MANGSLHPKEQELKDRLGKDYEVETPPPGAVIIGEGTTERKVGPEAESPVKAMDC